MQCALGRMRLVMKGSRTRDTVEQIKMAPLQIKSHRRRCDGRGMGSEAAVLGHKQLRVRLLDGSVEEL